MKWFKSLLFMLVITFVFAGGQAAESARLISIYTTGKVTDYKTGESIELLDGEGSSLTYFIMDDTEIPEEIKKGMVVEVSAAGVVAVKIELLSK